MPDPQHVNANASIPASSSSLKDRIMHRLMLSEKIRLIHRVFSDNFWEYRFRYVKASVFMAIAAIATGASAYIIKDIVNTVFSKGETTTTTLIGLLAFFIFTIKGFSTYAQTVILSRIGNSLVAGVQKKVFSHLINLPMSYFDRVTLGQIFLRASRGAGSTNTIIRTVIMSIGRDVLTLVALVAVMFIQEPLISSTTLIVGPFCGFLIGRAAKKNQKERPRSACSPRHPYFNYEGNHFRNTDDQNFHSRDRDERSHCKCD